jgi:hypothetical protein
MVHMNDGEVSELVTQEHWDNIKAILDRIWAEFVILKVAQEYQMPEDALSGMQHKQLERDRDFLINVAQTYPSMMPYLKGTHLTLDGCRGGRNEQGWKRAQSKMEALRRNGYLDFGWM